MGTTARGFEYADSTGHTRIWEHLQDTAESVDSYLDGRFPPRIATTTRTSDSSTVTTVETVIDSVTAALVSGRTYRVRWTPGVDSTASSDTVFVRLREDNLAGTQMQIMRVSIAAAGGTGTRYPAVVEAEYTAGATGNKTFVTTLVRGSGTGDCTIHASGTMPVYLTVEYVSG